MPHGLICILQFLTHMYLLTKDNSTLKIISKIIDIIKNAASAHGLSCFPYSSSRNGYEQISGKYPSRLAWCYGDLIIGYALLSTGKRLDDQKLIQWANDIINRTLKRQTYEETGVVDGYFCHGSAGLAHIYHKIFIETADQEVLAAAYYWLNYTIEFVNSNRREGSNLPVAGSNGLLVGTAGIGLVAYSFLTKDFSWDYLFF